MASTVESHLNEMGITVPDAPAPAANYVPWVKSGNMVYVAGQVPFVDGKLTATGHLGDNASVEDGYEQAKICAINLIAQVRIDTGEHVAVQRSCSVPDVAEEEQQREGCMAEGEPAAG